MAAGVVTWAGPRGGFGNMVQIDHGNGYATRYGHAFRVLVHVGETVQRGDVIGLVGHTGRSTGPHVHFEVLKSGHEVNPAKLRRAAAAPAFRDPDSPVAAEKRRCEPTRSDRTERSARRQHRPSGRRATAAAREPVQTTA